jgi:signal transduction histidine kinase
MDRLLTRKDSAVLLVSDATLHTIVRSLDEALTPPLERLREAASRLACERDEAPLDPAHSEQWATISGLCDDLLELARGFLDSAGLSLSDLVAAEPETTSIGAILNRVDERHAAEAAARGLGWSCDVEGQDATVTIDTSRCLQLVGHLVAGALRFTPRGGSVRVVGRASGDEWSVTVADTGPDTPSSLLPRMLEPFYRSRPRDDAGETGHDLGLASCRALAERLGAELVVGMAPRGGRLAQLRLPMRAED